ncbi:hypothetical protein KVP10_00110 [Candidimonas humi]|jgi:hypothetical protein|uniref:Uncharacterized protein n=1 Tax=Candidimonas humi TaxID=683355 RepID=A0ABV8NV64_9BURK|nr:hypothetical protein [Candidimonas humi]MBV6303264.1 hypothetical protein [Candidimonas humi]
MLPIGTLRVRIASQVRAAATVRAQVGFYFVFFIFCFYYFVATAAGLAGTIKAVTST